MSRRSAPATTPAAVDVASTITVDEDRHMRAVAKLQALAYLCSQAHAEVPAASEVFHGLAWLIEEAVDHLAAVNGGAA